MSMVAEEKPLLPIQQLKESLAALRQAALFVPTPWGIARQMLEFAKAGPEDTVYDLGSGDGRIPILAAQEFGCTAVGVELDADLCAHSRAQVEELGLEGQVSFECADLFRADVRQASIVTLYLLSDVNGHIRPRLASQLKPGARIVAVDFEVPGWRPACTCKVLSEAGVEYALFLYERPHIERPHVSISDATQPAALRTEISGLIEPQVSRSAATLARDVANAD